MGKMQNAIQRWSVQQNEFLEKLVTGRVPWLTPDEIGKTGMRKENVEKHFMSIGFFSVLEKCPAPFIMRHAPGQGRVAPPASGMSHEVP